MAFYLKYRPQTIKDLDLASVREDLTRVLSNDSVPHSFLFAGPKGTGKTSAARIVAKVVNCEKRKKGSIEPCGECDECKAITKGTSIDVIELDAASHRGIDDIRALRDAVKLSPAHAKRKVYIIDEAHMLTTEASNALLKTLEEPPEHVIFILATTNPEKLIPTIRSRTTLIRFTKATVQEIVSSLEKKLKGEGIEAEKEALEQIALAADGAFRDADKLLEQLVEQGKKLTKAKVEEKLHASGSFEVSDFLTVLAEKDSVKALKIMSKALDAGVTAEVIIDSSIKTLRNALLSMVGYDKSETELSFEQSEAIGLIRSFVSAKGEIQNAPLEQIPLELAIVEWCSGSVQTPSSSDGGKENKDSTSNGNGHGPVLEEMQTQKEVRETKVLIGEGDTISPDLWAKVLSGVRPINASTEALLRASKPLEMSGNKLKLGVYYRFHKEHLESVNHRKVLEDVCTEVFGTDTIVECFLTEPPKVTPKADMISDSVVQQTTNSTTPPVDSAPPLEDDDQQAGAAVLSKEEDEQIMQMAKDIFGE